MRRHAVCAGVASRAPPMRGGSRKSDTRPHPPNKPLRLLLYSACTIARHAKKLIFFRDYSINQSADLHKINQHAFSLCNFLTMLLIFQAKIP